MFSKQLLSAVAAFSLVSGVVSISCKDATATVKSPADATALASCDSVAGSVLISKDAAGILDFGALPEIGGDLTALDNPNITSIRADFLETIGGALKLRNLIGLSSLQLTSLVSVDSIEWVTLTLLPEVTLGTPGITKAKSILIADTRLENLDGINVQTLTDMNLNNNGQMTKFTTSIKSLSNSLIINANGLKMQMEMPNLQWIANMTISNVTTFAAPSLRTVNGSVRFDSNYFTSLRFPNLTSIEEGDFSFVSNPQLANLTMPALTEVGGGFIIANNTALSNINGFPKLANIGGAIAIRGSFDDFDLPSLDDVRGTAVITSTEDIAAACKTFTDEKASEIQGKLDCKGLNANANNDTSDGDDSSDDSNTDNAQDAGALFSVNIVTVFSLAAVSVFYTAFL